MTIPTPHAIALLLFVLNLLGFCVIRIHLAMVEAARQDNFYNR